MKVSLITLVAFMLAMAPAASAYLKHLYCTDRGPCRCNKAITINTLLRAVAAPAGRCTSMSALSAASRYIKSERNEINLLEFPYTSCSAQLGEGRRVEVVESKERQSATFPTSRKP